MLTKNSALRCLLLDFSIGEWESAHTLHLPTSSLLSSRFVEPPSDGYNQNSTRHLAENRGRLNLMIKTVVLAKPRGFCAGVVRAIDIVERALDWFPEPIYVFHEIVHNQYVVETLSKRGVIFVDSLEEV